MNLPSSNRKERFKYYGTSGKDVPRFDPDSPLPKELEPTLRYEAHLGLRALPTLSLFSIFNCLFSKMGRFRTMTGLHLKKWMPANLSRLRPDKLSDEYFVERRLNGFNPGKLNHVEGKEWQYVVNYKTGKYETELGGILPEYSEARFVLRDRLLHVHSIEYRLKDQRMICVPTDGQQWEDAKYYFRSAEYVFQEIQSHLGRTHMNMDQYAMAFYRNVIKNPIHELLYSHFEGLLSIDKRGASLIIGNKGFIPEASALDPKSVDGVLIEEIAVLSYRWSPAKQALPDRIDNNYFDRSALAMWELLEKYVADFFINNQEGIQTYWSEIEAMSQELVAHSILTPELGTLAINDQEDLQQLCVYILYHCTFFHSWVNNKQYEDGGDVEYAAIGLWDKEDPNYDPQKVEERHDSQVKLMWSLANVHYNPAIEFAPLPLKKLLWEYRDRIEPGIPLDWIMMSINI
ncbi:lipoxygenase family protein [Anabaena cylindrica UHCC 0172]|uniref:lipoxygenase family protein n=1 Tax=Anabaena cylindrica TaxID=1165 RepID=UPI002B1ECC3B|nr:lipoxygenase family protein [Anabaena cylindrica]MEA5553081.1 lipoxygenase family protein [Anabaena cylindrica UHCC 0172]